MASIVLSFVGQQDPFAKTETEGSIVTLIRHLIATQHCLKQVLLLHTDGTSQNAIETRQWLLAEVPTLTAETIQIIPVSPAFSADPVNPLLATQAARQAVQQAKVNQTPADTLEFNASSGTPAMKTAWSVLQALGDASGHSHVWQVRNPQEMRPGQERVFYSDVNLLKDELDRKLIQQQINDYNYSGALISLQQSNLTSPVLAALLNYGYYRLSMDFDRAYSCLNPYATTIDARCLQDLAALRQNDRPAILREAYFNALIKLKNQKYAEFLIMLSGLQENVLRFLINHRLNLPLSSKYADAAQSWHQIRQVDQGKLYQHLQAYKLPKGGSLRLDSSISRYVQIAILEYYPQFAQIIPPIHELNDYCDQRNEAVHQFVGISEIKDEEKVLANLRKIIKQVAGNIDTNPFDRLNQYLRDRLTS